MSSKYDKTVSISREEEGSYNRRELEYSPSRSQPTTTTYTTKSYQVVPRRDDTSDDDNFEEWTTSKRKVNHKTRCVETRVSRQLLVEDGKVIADSGPQVVTRIKEDSHQDEREKEKTPKNRSRFEAIECAPEGESSGRVLGEKKEINRVCREVREENMQYHDERMKELTGPDVHRRAVQAPHELISIHDKGSHSAPRGKMVHYSNKGKTFKDTYEILEVAKLAIDGSITKEVKRTEHHEECSEDEKPDKTGEAEALRDAPTVTRSTRRGVDYVNDFDYSSDAEKTGRAHRPRQHGSPSRQRDTHSHPDEAFPRYEIDPLLNSLRDEDFRPSNPSKDRPGRSRYVELERTNRVESSDDEGPNRSQLSGSRLRSVSPRPVEIPEEYRVNKGRLLSGKTDGKAGHKERSFSPRSKLSHRSRKEDASVQAHLTDEEEEERKSIRSSSSGLNSHEKTTRHLQRQSTANSSRNYYFGQPKRSSRRRPSSASSLSSSLSSLSDPKERQRKQGVRSRDSGFKSPHSHRTSTPVANQQIYSVSRKSKSARQHRDRDGAVSPTPTTGSLGQRSVKTTTTTMSAGLADRPLASRSNRDAKTEGNKRTSEKVSKPPSPFQKLTKLFTPSSQKSRSVAT